MIRTDHLEQNIRRACFTIAADYTASLTAKSSGKSARTSGTREPPPPIPLHTIDIRAEACDRLASWAELIADHNQLTGPGINIRDAIHLARFTETWATWLASQESGGLCERELTDSAGKIQRLARGITIRRFPVGPCPETTPTEDAAESRCAGTLIATLNTGDTLLPSQVVCTTNPLHAWAAHQWIALGRRIHTTPTHEPRVA